jgi:hypothetical protein
MRQVAPFSELWLYRRAEGDESPKLEGHVATPEEPEIPRGVKKRPSWMKPEEIESEDPLALLDDAADDAQVETVAAETGNPNTVEPESL